MAANQIPRNTTDKPQASPQTVLELVVRRMGVPETRIRDFRDRMPDPVEARIVLAGLLYDCGGMSTGRIAAMLCTSRSIVSKWLHRWRGFGPAAHARWYGHVEDASHREVAA